MRLFLAVVFLLAGCAPAETPTPSAQESASLWGDVRTLGQVELDTAPAIIPGDHHIAAAWINADASGLVQRIDLLGGTSDGETALPLLMTRPYDLRLLPAAEGGFHLLWLDVDKQNPDDGSRLVTAYINRALTPERGPILASDQRTLRYATLSNGDASAWIVWSGGLIAEPGLYAQYIDNVSRPRVAERLTTAADWPTLVRSADGTAWLFWLWRDQVYRAILGDGVIREIQMIAPSVSPDRGDRLTGFEAAADSGGIYLFWNLTRADGNVETWFTYGEPDSTGWDAPQQLSIGWTTKGSFETGYNAGQALSAWLGDHPARWSTPAAGVADNLAVAAQVDDALALIYLQKGSVVGYQAIVTLHNDLIGAPSLAIDRNRYPILAWAEPTSAGVADLNLTTTRPLS